MPRQQPRGAQGAHEQTLEKRPFHGSILDLGIADRTQMELFAAVGRTKGPFQGVIDWPYLNNLVQDGSSSLLSSHGEDAWKAAGGIYGNDGKPTFAARSSHAAQIVHKIAADPGGFIWTDAQGTGWAVRLVTVDVGEPHEYGGLAISWNGGGRLIDPLAREEYRRAVEEQFAQLDAQAQTEARRQLENIANSMWLYERGEQLLWAIHAAVLMQRRSIVLLPDVGLGEIVWGGKRTSWPDNWRGSLADVLGSLSQLHLAMLQVGGTAWKPQFTMRSVAVASYEDLERNRKRGGFCRPGCPLWSGLDPHNHILVEISYSFLGLLEKFSIRDERGSRQFDFGQKKPHGEHANALIAGRKQGRIVPVHLPTKVFGPSGWSGLTRGHRGIIQALVREVTRVQKKGGSKRRDRAEVLVGNRLPDLRGRGEVICPLLLQTERYVSFNGNGLRRGLGYLIVGRKDEGWLTRCGYIDRVGGERKWTGRNGLGHTTRRFLVELDEVRQLLGLSVVGLSRTTGSWLTLSQMREIAELPSALNGLNEVHLRIYGPEEYLERCREVLAARGGFSIIPGADTLLATPDTDALIADANVDLRVRLRRAGLSQDDLASYLGISKSFISKLLNGRKAWPEGMREQAEAFASGSWSREDSLGTGMNTK